MSLKIKNTAYLRAYFLCLLFIAGALGLSAQGYWMQKAGGPTADEGYSISLDAGNNSYTTGYF
ncbi:MAG TPA: hypothetical protein VK890_08965, partial [Bacteroidia bacterium]|nr:hypothetical protein [Bacteroidia bacterium]